MVNLQNQRGSPVTEDILPILGICPNLKLLSFDIIRYENTLNSFRFVKDFVVACMQRYAYDDGEERTEPGGPSD